MFYPFRSVWSLFSLSETFSPVHIPKKQFVFFAHTAEAFGPAHIPKKQFVFLRGVWSRSHTKNQFVLFTYTEVPEIADTR